MIRKIPVNAFPASTAGYDKKDRSPGLFAKRIMDICVLPEMKNSRIYMRYSGIGSGSDAILRLCRIPLVVVT